MLKKLIIVWCILPIATSIYAQELYSLSELDTIYEYTSLNEALENKANVIKLTLKGKKHNPFPVEILQFPNLQQLTIKRANLKEIPSDIGKITTLQILDLSKNSIYLLPKEIGNLTNLKVLRLGQNEIGYLPIEIAKLKKLVILDLWSNNLTELPIEMENMSQLKYIDLRVIQFNAEKQETIRNMIPQAKIEFSNSCNCD